MRIARRTFLVASGALAAAPALALLPYGRVAASPWRPHAAAGSPNDVVFKIDGWSARGEVASSGSNEAWLTINKSSRTAWR